MRLILNILIYAFMALEVFAQEGQLYADLNGHVYVLENRSFQKLDQNSKEIERFDQSGIGVLHAADVSNPHYIALFSKTSQTIWILDNEFSIFDQVNLNSISDMEIDAMVLSNQTLYLLSNAQREWMVYDYYTNEIIYRVEFEEEIGEIEEFRICGNTIYLREGDKLWKTDLYSGYTHVKIEEGDKTSEIAGGCNTLISWNDSKVLLNPETGTYQKIEIPQLEANDMLTWFQGQLFIYRKKKLIVLKSELKK